MSYRLFHQERSASNGTRLLLEELGVEYSLKLVDIRPEAVPDAEMLALNPNGWIPVLQYEGGAMFEGAGIFVFLCDRHPEAGLAPAVGEVERGPFLQWLAFFTSSLQTAYQMTYHSERFVEDEADFDLVKIRSITRLTELWQFVDDSLDGKDWLLGERFSAADIYLFMLSSWLNPAVGHPQIQSFANVFRVVRGVMARPRARELYAWYVDDIENGIPRESWWPGS